jgi:hypothetical protein
MSRALGFDMQSMSSANTVEEMNQIVSLTDVLQMNFETIKLKGRFEKVLGEPYRPFYIMMYGLPFNGKSSAALLLADDLMKYHKMKALYVMNEERLDCKKKLHV